MAGEALRRAHSSVSTQIQTSEEHLDVRLFDRTTRRVNWPRKDATFARALRTRFTKYSYACAKSANEWFQTQSTVFGLFLKSGIKLSAANPGRLWI